jgi:TetR/AcrR family transcriptional regulator
MAQPSNLGVRAEKTRAALLEAAESLFAERGFDATRLEDIAERVGIRRASIVYYFKDKRELYDAVLAEVVGGLYDTMAQVLSRDAPLSERIDAGISAWVDYVGRRPTIARIILREVANSSPEKSADVLEHTKPFAALILKEIYGRPDFEEETLSNAHPVHVASTVAGATVFFVAAMPSLFPDLRIDPTSPEHIATHKEQLLHVVRHLLGTRPA